MNWIRIWKVSNDWVARTGYVQKQHRRQQNLDWNIKDDW